MTASLAEHRPALRRRRFRHDNLVAVDLFSGFGGLTKGIEQAGFTTIMAANHNEYKILVHEANHPTAEHWRADLVDPEASDYHSARDLPAADMLAAGISCKNHTVANSKKAYAEGLSLFELDDPEYEASVTRSERDRATANCVLHYAAQHHPRLILIECTTELTSWGSRIPGTRIGDGSTYRWWLKQFELLGYKYRVLYLNSMFFGVPQSRDRLYIAMWDRRIPTPDLDHRPLSWCSFCERMVEAVWTWKTGVPPSGSVRYGTQYEYRCQSCRGVVIPPMTPSLAALDLSDLGTRIGDRDKPLADTTMARAERCRQRFAEFPAVLVPAKAQRGSERHLGQPFATQTSQQETALLSTGWVLAGHRHNGEGKHFTQPMDTVTSTHEKAVLLAIDNYQGVPRGADEALPTQLGSETLGLVSSGVIPYRRNTVPTMAAEPMPTVTSEQIPGLLTAAGMIKHNGSLDEVKYRSYSVGNPLGTIVGSSVTQGMLFSGWQPQQPADEWQVMLSELALEDCYYRMMGSHEIGRGSGFDVNFGAYQGSFVVWGSARKQTDGFGNAVSPPVGEWLGSRLREALHSLEAA
ncbi:DNA cytosine methyltransferase [Mycolicibacterium fortuitum]|uniref:DNA (cytosine-5-)-methyltransferase n=2 Tax=Mycolicibacterium fortuitum TaxID=1766 RepID=A0AAE4VD52_MYCFO|nr:DNA cytosine methyltransferase [Mycolicibacterium fortuitum]MCV7137853.1 DNA cytosine methyltransferase [Mycolicibacterium fortuitum]MDV7193357.1 DNA cytosine methyltransferase [Mycolicibacterium fortuitum]MDV7205962.1 DNA cytosine methyltransferase [Mycolicibacterium fortuitum]MDV7227375.1 DNA cytosine methyltransferase [Mycolicibacterium fortuitum]MDV7259928.1 DNA cytosine methyltransferase [Mycolicibacterium fortuitum]